jgi:hypothetical protein
MIASMILLVLAGACIAGFLAVAFGFKMDLKAKYIVSQMVGFQHVDPKGMGFEGQGFRDIVRLGALAVPHLLDKIVDETETQCYHIQPYKVGDIALGIFLEMAGLDIEDFLEGKVLENYRLMGAAAYFQWAKRARNRFALQKMLREWWMRNSVKLAWDAEAMRFVPKKGMAQGGFSRIRPPSPEKG